MLYFAIVSVNSSEKEKNCMIFIIELHDSFN